MAETVPTRNELIERLEMATGPDAELDYAVYHYVHYGLGDDYGLQSYTASIDAANDSCK